MLTPLCDSRVVVQLVARVARILKLELLRTRLRTWKRSTKQLTTNGSTRGELNFCEDPSAARDDQPDSSVEETSDTGDADANADQDDSAKAAHDKYLSYLTFKQPTGLRNDAKSRNTLRVRDFFLYCSVATCPRHLFRDHASRLVHCPFRRLCTRDSCLNWTT